MTNVSFKPRSQYLLVTAEGSIGRDEIIHTLRAIYSKESPRGVLWDLRKANLDQVRLSDFKFIATFVKDKIGRTGGKTAYVGSQDVFRQSNMYAAVASMEGVLVENAAFLRFEDAENWILSGSSRVDHTTP